MLMLVLEVGDSDCRIKETYCHYHLANKITMSSLAVWNLFGILSIMHVSVILKHSKIMSFSALNAEKLTLALFAIMNMFDKIILKLEEHGLSCFRFFSYQNTFFYFLYNDRIEV